VKTQHAPWGSSAYKAIETELGVHSQREKLKGIHLEDREKGKDLSSWLNLLPCINSTFNQMSGEHHDLNYLESSKYRTERCVTV
jgi:hypothetical protein